MLHVGAQGRVKLRTACRARQARSGSRLFTCTPKHVSHLLLFLRDAEANPLAIRSRTVIQKDRLVYVHGAYHGRPRQPLLGQASVVVGSGGTVCSCYVTMMIC